MSDKKLEQQLPEDLRLEAEARLAAGKRSAESSDISEVDPRVLVHELQVHQIELQMQNEELRRVNAELDEAQRRYSNLYEFAPVAYFMLDENGAILSANLAGAELLGLERSRLVGTSFRNFVDPSCLADFVSFFDEVLTTAEKQRLEVRLGRAKGKPLYALIEAIAADREGKSPIQCRMSAIDVTGRTAAEDALRNSEAKYHTIFEAMTEGFALHEIICDENGKPVDCLVLEANPAFERVMGLSPAEVIGRTVLEVMPDADASWIETYGRVAFTREPVRFERYSQAFGKYLEVYAYSPAPRQFATLIMDVTERTLAEEHKLDFYRQTIRAATDGKLVITEPSEMLELVGQSLEEWDIETADDLMTVRVGSLTRARAEGVDEQGIKRLATCIGEAASNALKHAGGGKASFHCKQDSVLFKVQDKGPGIGAMSIPHVALARGYSTAGTLGMGYKMMISAADRVYLATEAEGTSVVCEVRTGKAAGPPVDTD